MFCKIPDHQLECINGSVYKSGSNGVAGDAVFSPFTGQLAGIHIDSAFTCTVGNVVLLCSDQAFYRGKIQNPSLFLRDHKPFSYFTGNPVERGDVYIHNRLEGLVVIFLSRDQTVDSGTVYKDIYSAEGVFYGVEHLVCAFCISQIAGEG